VSAFLHAGDYLLLVKKDAAKTRAYDHPGTFSVYIVKLQAAVFDCQPCGGQSEVNEPVHSTGRHFGHVHCGMEIFDLCGNSGIEP
jgi:hypothetical protein